MECQICDDGYGFVKKEKTCRKCPAGTYSFGSTCKVKAEIVTETKLDEASLSKGAIAGIVLGSLVFAVMIGILGHLVYLRALRADDAKMVAKKYEASKSEAHSPTPNTNREGVPLASEESPVDLNSANRSP